MEEDSAKDPLLDRVRLLAGTDEVQARVVSVMRAEVSRYSTGFVPREVVRPGTLSPPTLAVYANSSHELAREQILALRPVELLLAGSVRHTPCPPPCKDGRISCDACEKGWAKCPKTVTCPACGGDKCGACKQTGRSACPKCGGKGERPCGKCDRKGVLTHPLCEGSARLTTYTIGTFTPTEKRGLVRLSKTGPLPFTLWLRLAFGSTSGWRTRTADNLHEIPPGLDQIHEQALRKVIGGPSRKAVGRMTVHTLNVAIGTTEERPGLRFAAFQSTPTKPITDRTLRPQSYLLAPSLALALIAAVTLLLIL